MKKKNEQSEKLKWVIKQGFEKGKSRCECIKLLLAKYPKMKPNYARTIIYNSLCYLNWTRSPYPPNRKKAKKKAILDSNTKALLDENKNENSNVSSSVGENEFTF
jgi:hypothetical protein